jgi:molybdopterin-guanine dinucleotide biosynthesis protein A
MSGALPPVYGAVLIGGRSERMGQPKHLLEFGGRTLLERAVAALRLHVERVVLVGAGEIPAAHSNLPRVTDAPHLRGPLAGMLGALASQSNAAWVFAACDLPRIDPGAVAWLIAQRRPTTIAVLPRSAAGCVEPLLALYEPAARDPLEALARPQAGADRAARRCANGIGPRALAQRPDVATPDVSPELRACWMNVNEPHEWAALIRDAC